MKYVHECEAVGDGRRDGVEGEGEAVCANAGAAVSTIVTTATPIRRRNEPLNAPKCYHRPFAVPAVPERTSLVGDHARRARAHTRWIHAHKRTQSHEIAEKTAVSRV